MSTHSNKTSSGTQAKFPSFSEKLKIMEKSDAPKVKPYNMMADSNLTGNEYRVLDLLNSFCSRLGHCFFSDKYFEENFGFVNIQTFWSILRSLQKKGYISKYQKARFIHGKVRNGSDRIIVTHKYYKLHELKLQAQGKYELVKKIRQDLAPMLQRNLPPKPQKKHNTLVKEKIVHSWESQDSIIINNNGYTNSRLQGVQPAPFDRLINDLKKRRFSKAQIEIAKELLAQDEENILKKESPIAYLITMITKSWGRDRLDRQKEIRQAVEKKKSEEQATADELRQRKALALKLKAHREGGPGGVYVCDYHVSIATEKGHSNLPYNHPNFLSIMNQLLNKTYHLQLA